MFDQLEEAEFTDDTSEYTRPANKNWLVFAAFFIILLNVFAAASLYLVSYLQTPPDNFPVNQPIVIEPGSSTKEIVELMKSENLTQSKYALYLYLRLKHENDSLKADTYIFTEPLAINKLAERLIAGDPGSNLIKFTHIEGESLEKLAERAQKTLNNFSAVKFLELTKNHEGRLFPETYLIPADFTEQEMFDLLSTTFNKKIEFLKKQIEKSDFSLDEIIILASIIEREANSTESMQIVSGILQNRLKIGMALQVDASLEYALDKPLSQLKAEDLEIDSPYNTYLNAGLPPTPIGNPGLVAIEAVLNPTKTNNMFYITGYDGNFYYAKTFEEHKQNIARYLR